MYHDFLLLECVSSGTIRKFEWIFRQFKEETRRLSSAKSRVDDAEMAQKMPKLQIKEFLRHTLVSVPIVSSACFQANHIRKPLRPIILFAWYTFF